MAIQAQIGSVYAPSDRSFISTQKIERLAQQIAARRNPERIYLFGSYAYGQPTTDSDVDLMVVMDAEDVRHQASLIRDSVDFDFPLELLVRTPAYFAERLTLGDFFIAQIYQQGKVLYDSGRSTFPNAIAQPLVQGPIYKQVGGAYLNKLTAEWVKKAERDYSTITLIEQTNNSDFDDVICFHAQQCAEKYFKAYLQEHGVRSGKTHELDLLQALCEKVDPSFLQLQGAVTGKLKDYAVDPRYPGTDPTPSETQIAYQNMMAIRAFVRARLGV